MIKIDFKKFARDHIWFGWYSTYVINGGTHEETTEGYEWRYSVLWSDRLRPARHKDKYSPIWWYKLWRKTDNWYPRSIF